MDIKENIAGLGKNHDKESRENDIAKKQSEAKPAAENLDMTPNSRNTKGDKDFSADDQTIKNLHHEAEDYAKEEHEKAAKWENTATDNDKPTF